MTVVPPATRRPPHPAVLVILKIARVLCWLWVAAGLLTGVFGLLAAAHSYSWLKDAVPISGKIVAIEPYGGDSHTFYPIYEITNLDGKPMRIRGPVAYSPRPTIGAIDDLAYPPGHLSEAGPTGFITFWLMPLILGSIAAVFLVIGTVSLVVVGYIRRQVVSDG